MWLQWHFNARQPDVNLRRMSLAQKTLCPVFLGTAPLRWTGHDPALRNLTGPLRVNYLYAAQSETQGMWKQDIGGTQRFLAHKIKAGFPGHGYQSLVVLQE